jgi:hypothetical protein
MAAGALSGLQNPETDHRTVGLISAAPSGIFAGWRLAPYPADKTPETDRRTVGLISEAPSGIIAGWRLAPYPAYKTPKSTTEP